MLVVGIGSKFNKGPAGPHLENRVKEVATVTTAEPKRTEDGQMVVPDFVIDTLARCLLPQMHSYFASEEGQAAFEEWKRQQETQ